MTQEDTYKTITDLAEGLYTEKRSKFISIAIPVRTLDEIKEHLEVYQKKYYDARHVCYAYMLGHERLNFRANDNGEPSGTAGKPILNQILSKDVTNVCVVVVRYFGGTLLGTGGLVRAYTKAASGAVLAAGVVLCTKLTTLLLDATYADYQKILPLFERKDLTVESTDFSDRVQILFSLPTTEREALLHRVTEATFGRVKVTEQGERYGFL